MDPYESFGLGQDMLFSSAGPGSDPQDGRLSRALADLQQDVSLLRARLSSIEEAVVLLNKANETDKMGARPDLFPSGDSSSIFGNISPGAAAVDPAPATSVRPSMPPSSGVVAGSGAAARLAARFNRLGSIAQGHRPPGRPSPAAQASNASTSGTQMAHKIKPVPFKNGITLVKDRRLINQIFLTKHLGPLFESIVEQERLRIRPLIDKEANARTDVSCYTGFSQISDATVESQDRICR
ncbi:hypothetical protein OC861_000243 [Tilletia horrida]|nr:hypothetical protein OC861_000243 [Tilletia horrida]